MVGHPRLTIQGMDASYAQIIEFDSGGTHGETKNNYRVVPQYRELLQGVLEETSATVSDVDES